MMILSPETELLARRVAAARHRTVDDAIREALQASARAAGIAFRGPLRSSCRQTAGTGSTHMEELAAMPVLDKRSLQEIVDDLNAA